MEPAAEAVDRTDTGLADELERLIEQDALWDRGEFDRATARLAALAGEPAVTLIGCFQTLRAHLEAARLDDPLRRDVEGVLYPRLWKVVESVRDGLPVGEQMIRIRALGARLDSLFPSS